MKKLYILILSFRAPQFLAACLRSLEAAKIPAGWQKKVLVIDNNSKNRGFSAGCNLGIKQALNHGADAVLLLNQDTQVSKDFLITLVKNPADIVAPVIKFKRRGRWTYDYGGKINWWLGRTEHRERQYAIRETECVSKIDYVSGCAMLIRRPVLEKIGLLDERYFLYFEDVDFCIRAQKAGFKIAIELRSAIFHKLSERKPLAQRWQLVKSNLIFINRWLPLWRRPIAWGYWFLISIKILLT